MWGEEKGSENTGGESSITGMNNIEDVVTTYYIPDTARGGLNRLYFYNGILPAAKSPLNVNLKARALPLNKRQMSFRNCLYIL